MTPSRTEGNLFLGYDARHDPNRGLLENVEYRQRHLFKEDVSTLASVDTSIWPSIFDLRHALKRPAFVGPVQDLWADSNSLVKCLSALETDLVIIAIKLVASEKPIAYLDEWIRRTESVQHFPTSDCWKLLGYDVADRYLTSSLFNCGLGEEGKFIALDGKPVGVHLNDHHLFVSSKCADEFASMSNEMVKEHAPFFSYEIWQKNEKGNGRGE